MFNKIRTKKVYMKIVEQIRDLIIEGKWAPKEKIPNESQLCNLFGVSRTSLRSAIEKLCAIGLLEKRQGDGTYTIDTNFM